LLYQKFLVILHGKDKVTQKTLMNNMQEIEHLSTYSTIATLVKFMAMK